MNRTLLDPPQDIPQPLGEDPRRILLEVLPLLASEGFRLFDDVILHYELTVYSNRVR